MDDSTNESLVDRDQRLVWHPFTQMKTAAPPIPIAEAYGAVLIDDQGNEIIDAIGSWWTNLHGHSHPHIASSIHQQAQRLPHVMFAGFTHDPAVSVCERMQKWLPKHLNKFFFSDNGSTAVEIALKMALQSQRQKHVGESELKKPLTVIAFENGYHGDTFGAMAVGERDVFVKPYEPYLFDVVYVPAPIPGQEKTARQQLRKVLNEHDVAAFVFEPLIQGAGGMRMHEPEALDAMIRICRENGVLTIADEVMTGFFKTGTCLAIHQLKSQVDFICLSKALTSGTLPLALTVTTQEIYNSFYDDNTANAFFHGHSYTANPIGCAAALANFDLIEAVGFKKNLARVTDYLTSICEDYSRKMGKSNCPYQSVRHKGLVLALELKVDQPEGYLSKIGTEIYRQMVGRGVLVRPLGEVIYVVPPVCISNDQLDVVFETIDEVVAGLGS